MTNGKYNFSNSEIDSIEALALAAGYNKGDAEMMATLAIQNTYDVETSDQLQAAINMAEMYIDQSWVNPCK